MKCALLIDFVFFFRKEEAMESFSAVWPAWDRKVLLG